MNRSRLQIAKPDIVAFFEKKAGVLKEREIASVLAEQRGGWRLAQSTTVDAFIAFLLKGTKLKSYRLDFPNKPERVFVWGEVPLLQVLLHLKPRSYYSHYTAMRFHGLTEQVPKVLYLSHERTTPAVRSTLTQSAIDEAFRRPVRASHNEATFKDHRVMLLNGAFTDELGVIDHEARLGSDQGVQVRVTNVERTLIDAAVRPIYCGGVFEVAKAFEVAKDEVVSVNALGAMLQKMNFAYPYHQVIGFYLERAGYRPRALDLMRRFPMEFDFYLTHEMGPTRYVQDWRLHVPKGF